MALVRRFLGPSSKYDPDLPFTYEARVQVTPGTDIFNSYFSDTICGLLEFLDANGFSAEETTVVEIYEGNETIMESEWLTDRGGRWLHKPDICRSLAPHYRGHIFKGGCDFQDRDPFVTGP